MYKLSSYVTPSSSLHFCDKCGRGNFKAEGEAHSRVQLTLYRPLSVIFWGSSRQIKSINAK